MPRKRPEARPVQVERARPWCRRCGGTVIWPGPPERCLMCSGASIEHEGEEPDSIMPFWGSDGLGLIRLSRAFVDAVHAYDLLAAVERAADEGGSGVS